MAAHRDQPVIEVAFDYNRELIDELKIRTDARWSVNMNCWYIPQERFVLNEFFNAMKPVAYIDCSALKNKGSQQVNSQTKGNYSPSAMKKLISPETREKIGDFRMWLEQKRYGENTIKTYIHQLGIFFGYYSDIAPENITIQNINAFNNEFILKYNLSFTFQNQTISALKKFYGYHYNRDLNAGNLERPRRSHSLPKVMDKADLKKFFESIKNIKHKMAFETIYDTLPEAQFYHSFA